MTTSLVCPPPPPPPPLPSPQVFDSLVRALGAMTGDIEGLAAQRALLSDCPVRVAEASGRLAALQASFDLLEAHAFPFSREALEARWRAQGGAARALAKCGDAAAVAGGDAQRFGDELAAARAELAERLGGLAAGEWGVTVWVLREGVAVANIFGNTIQFCLW